MSALLILDFGMRPHKIVLRLLRVELHPETLGMLVVKGMGPGMDEVISEAGCPALAPIEGGAAVPPPASHGRLLSLFRLPCRPTARGCAHLCSSMQVFQTDGVVLSNPARPRSPVSQERGTNRTGRGQTAQLTLCGTSTSRLRHSHLIACGNGAMHI